MRFDSTARSRRALSSAAWGGLLLLAGAAAAAPGPDVTVYDLIDISRNGTANGAVGYSIGTTSCNVGGQPVNWCDNARRLRRRDAGRPPAPGHRPEHLPAQERPLRPDRHELAEARLRLHQLVRQRLPRLVQPDLPATAVRRRPARRRLHRRLRLRAERLAAARHALRGQPDDRLLSTPGDLRPLFRHRPVGPGGPGRPQPGAQCRRHLLGRRAVHLGQRRARRQRLQQRVLPAGHRSVPPRTTRASPARPSASGSRSSAGRSPTRRSFS